MDIASWWNGRYGRIFSILLRIILLQAVGLPANGDVHAAGLWYVAPTGSDSNSCTAPDLPCLTINGAIARAAAGDTVKVAVGTYTGIYNYVLEIDKSISLLGGWDAAFTTQVGLSTIDGQETRALLLAGTTPDKPTVLVDHFVMYHGASRYSYGPAGIENYGDLTISNSIVKENADSALGGAVVDFFGSTLTIRNSTISDNAGAGISIQNAVLTISDSTVSGNGGKGIKSNSSNVTMNNITVSDNRGGGIGVYDSSAAINNSTITGNLGWEVGGGISAGLSTVTLRNSIVAGNISLGGSPDCLSQDPINSSGYNLIGSGSGCSFIASTGDQVGTDENLIDPRLGPLLDNGGPTLTHGLAADSPARDAGNPAPPGSGGDACLAADQRGTARPVDGICDIGAFEGTATWVQSVWYVAPTGDDANSCEAAEAPCQTINAAMGRAVRGDIIKLGIGIYTGAGKEVVLIDKDLSLLGGWDAPFAAQVGLSTIDGGETRQGITIGTGRKAEIERIVVQNAVAKWIGGGIYNGGFLTLEDSLIAHNTGAWSWGASGIYGDRHTVTTINSSTITGNAAGPDAAVPAIRSFGTLTLNNSTVSGNTGAPAIISNGSLALKNITIAGNPRGGIDNRQGAITLSNSIVALNTAGGGKDCSGTAVSAGYNLIGNATGCSFAANTGDLVGTGTHPIKPRLGPLADHGGPTFTHSLLGGSPALNAGSPAEPGSGGDACLASDQRGLPRPFAGACDMGAYEADVLLVKAIERVNPSPTAAFVVQFKVNFTEAVTGVDTNPPL